MSKDNIKKKEKKIKKSNSVTTNDDDNAIDNFDNEIKENDSIVSIIFKFIKSFKLSYNTNITNIQIPAIFVAPKSTLTFFSDSFINNFDILLKAIYIDNYKDRLLSVVKYFGASLFHIPVHSKPLNPCLGETQFINFHIDMGNGNIETDNYCCIEQISHHPPRLLLCIYNKKYDVKVTLDLILNFLFMGTYIMVDLKGESYIKIKDEIYTTIPPNLYGRFIRGFSEFVGPFSIVSNNYKYSIKGKFNEKPLIGGEYDTVNMYLYNEFNETTHQYIGQWTKDIKVIDLKTKESKHYHTRPQPTIVKRIDDTSLPTDSSNIWKGVFDAHNQGNNKLKSIEKRKVEKQQRQLANERSINNIQWVPKHFIKCDQSNKWDIIN